MSRTMVLPLLLAWALAPAFSRPVRAEPPSPQQPAADSMDLCSYLKDVETKTDVDCDAANLAVLKAKDPAAYARKVELARRRKSEVLKVCELLKAQPSEASQPKQSALPKLDPPINERTFPAWFGPEAKDLKEVHTRWLQAQNQELQQEKENPVSPERRKEIDAAIAKNHARIMTLGKIKDPGEMSCFLGETCGTRSDVSGPSVSGALTGRGSWTKADYERANQEANQPNRFPGEKIDRGVPTMGMLASEVVGNTPLGPLVEKPAGGGGSGLGTVANVALATTGALLLFGGLGGKALEEKFPNIRRDMGIAAAVTGTVAIGATAWPNVARLVNSPQTIPVAMATGRAVNSPAKTPVSFALTKGDARNIIINMQLPTEQARHAFKAIKRATTSSSFRITQEAGDVVIRTTRSGRNGYQLFEYRIAPDGKLIPIQKAYDAAGNLVHYDPK